MTPLQTANKLTKAAELARQDGNAVASLEIALVAAQYVQLAKALGHTK